MIIGRSERMRRWRRAVEVPLAGRTLIANMRALRARASRVGYIRGMRRVGWHLDDVPQPFLTFRRIAFLLLALVVLAAITDGILLGYDITHRRSPVAPLLAFAVIAVVGMVSGGIFGWTNNKSPRWREWRKSMPTLTPGWPPDNGS